MAEETAQLRAALEAAKSENELLLEQITRLCCHIEQTSGGAVDPIEVMHGRAPPEIKTTPPATPASSWIRGLLSRTGIVDDGGAGSRNGASRLAWTPRLSLSRSRAAVVRAAGEDKPPLPKETFSNATKMRSEAQAPFRVARMFLFGAFGANATLGWLARYAAMADVPHF